VENELTLTVTGMTCGGCEKAVTGALSGLAGVSNVSASHRDSRVRLTYDPSRVDLSTITKRVEDAGYVVAR
jgi:copper chaperone